MIKPVTDFHVHTSHSYCAPGMEIPAVLGKVAGSELKRVMLVCHSGQLYVPPEQYWSKEVMRNPELVCKSRREKTDRVAEFLSDTEPFRSESVLVGLEVDADFYGEMVLHGDDAGYFDYLLGSFHFLPAAESWKHDRNRAIDDSVNLYEKFMGTGIHILAHPFRCFVHAGIEAPMELVEPVAEIAREAGIALELTFHTHRPVRALFVKCIELGVPISIGTDSHELAEVGDFSRHMEFLEALGAGQDNLFN